MARLNLEDDFLTSPAFHDLCEHFKGDTAKAIGETVLFWFAAQRRWRRGELLPLKEFKSKWAIFLEVGIAEERDGAIYSCGAESQFAWLQQRREAGRQGGIKSGESRRNAPKQNEAKASKTKQRQANATGDEAKASKTNPLTLTHTQRSDINSNELISVAPASPSTTSVKKGAVAKAWVQHFVARYVEAFQRRYGTRPVVDGLAAGEAVRIVQGLGYPRCLDAAEGYLQMENPKYLAKCHDLTTFRMDMQSVKVAIALGVEEPNKNSAWERTAREFKDDEHSEGGHNGQGLIPDAT